ncbi:DUF1279 domain containing protein [Nitzschia inconspicua]|uniref:DUF1279 domain containing protein n=1 Tax=Nitzschia inconspicua TaxID=303405 RepID=A0A9K3L8G0_9STRA|nr:DUF1279 domain containing protein [Nitzschia inconspicua]
MSVKSFLKTYGSVGIGVYGGITSISICSIYATLRNGIVDVETMVTTPLAEILGKDAEVVHTVRKRWQDVMTMDNNDTAASNQRINWTREGAFLGIATLIDSVVLPIKLAVALPLAKMIVTRGRKVGR